MLNYAQLYLTTETKKAHHRFKSARIYVAEIRLQCFNEHSASPFFPSRALAHIEALSKFRARAFFLILSNFFRSSLGVILCAITLSALLINVSFVALKVILVH